MCLLYIATIQTFLLTILKYVVTNVLFTSQTELTFSKVAI